MNERKVYLTGTFGFKSAVMDKLGYKWACSAQDIGRDLVSFPLQKNVTPESFKKLIGADVMSDHNVMVFYDLNNNPVALW